MSVSGVSSGSSATGVNKFAELSSESFVKIMTAELTSQDPLKPNDSSHILEQMSSLRQIESSTSLTNKLDQLVTQSQFSAASNLLGATISGISENGTRQAGTAMSIVRTTKGSMVVLDTGYKIAVSNIDTVDIPVQLPPQTPATNNPVPATPAPTTATTAKAPFPVASNTPEAGAVGAVTASTGGSKR